MAGAHRRNSPRQRGGTLTAAPEVRRTVPPNASTRFAEGVLRDLELRDADRDGKVAWSLRHRRANPDQVTDELTWRQDLMHEAGPQRVPVSPKLRTLIERFHAIPVYDARAAWVHDPRLPQDAPPKLMINVGLFSEAMPTGLTTVGFSSNLPPGSDLSQLSPVDLDPYVYVVEDLGGNPVAQVFEITAGRMPK